MGSGPVTFRVWTATGMERVGRTDPARELSAVVLSAARGEYEGFQVVVLAAGAGVTVRSLTVSDLKGPGGNVIPASAASLYREHYVEIKHQSSPYWEDVPVTTAVPDPPGWFADALIPFVDPATGRPPVKAEYAPLPAAVEPGMNQPFWVDLFVPRGTPAGKYRGKWELVTDRGKASGDIILTVLDFELPLVPHLKSSFDLWNDRSPEACETILRHRLSPKLVPPAEAKRFMEQYGMNCTAAGFWSGADVKNKKMKPAPSAAEFEEARAMYPGDLLVYNYTADEIVKAPELYRGIKKWARNMHEAGVLNLITMGPVFELWDDGGGGGRSAVDIWVIQPNYYYDSPANVAEAMQRGQEVWTYTALVQDPYSPKWLVDFPPVHHRIMQGFMNQAFGFTGLLVWAADYWTKDPWRDVDYLHEGRMHFPGEGMCVYPGAQCGCKGTVPSIRLKWMREGVEDYEYIELLKRAGRPELAAEIVRTVARDWKDWSQNLGVLEAARRRLGEALAGIQK